MYEYSAMPPKHWKKSMKTSNSRSQHLSTFPIVVELSLDLVINLEELNTPNPPQSTSC